MNRDQVDIDYRSMTRAAFSRKYGIHEGTIKYRKRLNPETHIADLLYKPRPGINGAVFGYKKKSFTVSELTSIACTSLSWMRKKLVSNNNDANSAIKEGKALKPSPRRNAKMKYNSQASIRRKNPNDASSQSETLTVDQEKLLLMQSWRDDGANDDQILFRLKGMR